VVANPVPLGILNTVTNAEPLCRAVPASPHATSDRMVRGAFSNYIVSFTLDSRTGHVAPSETFCGS